MHAPSDTPRFLVDENAARLVRWLRLLGYDAVRLPGAGDADLVDLAGREQRMLLTRDRGILVRRPIVRGEVRALHLDSDDTWQQLAQVVRACGLDSQAAVFTRCVACNGALEPATVEESRPHVPPFVAATQRQFTRCPGCGRYYWRGTHWRRVTDRLAGLSDGATDS
jgi:uncharacterized protein with PIN domain